MCQRLRLAGKGFDVRWLVTVADRGRQAVWTGEGPARSDAISEFHFYPNPGGTRFGYVLELKPPGGLLGRLRLARRAQHVAAAARARALAGAAEGVVGGLTRVRAALLRARPVTLGALPYRGAPAARTQPPSTPHLEGKVAVVDRGGAAGAMSSPRLGDEVIVAAVGVSGERRSGPSSRGASRAVPPTASPSCPRARAPSPRTSPSSSRSSSVSSISMISSMPVGAEADRDADEQAVDPVLALAEGRAGQDALLVEHDRVDHLHRGGRRRVERRAVLEQLDHLGAAVARALDDLLEALVVDELARPGTPATFV